jgi:hypothetical protein
MNRIQSVERRNGQLASVLWDATINSEYDIALLERLNDEIKKENGPI